jgi:hypothetical protein
MSRATLIEKFNELQQTVGQSLAELQSSEADKFVAHLYQREKLSASVRWTE